MLAKRTEERQTVELVVVEAQQLDSLCKCVGTALSTVASKPKAIACKAQARLLRFCCGAAIDHFQAGRPRCLFVVQRCFQ